MKRDIETLKKNQSEKRTQEEINNKLHKIEGQISDVEDKITENTHSEQQKEKQILKKWKQFKWPLGQHVE